MKLNDMRLYKHMNIKIIFFVSGLFLANQMQSMYRITKSSNGSFDYGEKIEYITDSVRIHVTNGKNYYSFCIPFWQLQGILNSEKGYHIKMPQWEGVVFKPQDAKDIEEFKHVIDKLREQ